jgi:hypothetical protein
MVWKNGISGVWHEIGVISEQDPLLGLLACDRVPSFTTVEDVKIWQYHDMSDQSAKSS